MSVLRSMLQCSVIFYFQNNFQNFNDYVTYTWAPDQYVTMPDGYNLYTCSIPERYFKYEAGSYLLAYFCKQHTSPISYSEPFVVSEN